MDNGGGNNTPIFSYAECISGMKSEEVLLQDHWEGHNFGPYDQTLNDA